MAGQDREISAEERRAIEAAAEKAFEFGAMCAEPAGAETFDDPVMHTYYLFFVFGALDWLGDHLDPARPLRYEAKLTAMGAALSRFEDSDLESVRGTVLMIHNANDEPALKIREAGGRAAEEWLRGDPDEARSAFVRLMDDPSNFPREVDPVSAPPDQTRH